MMRSISVKVLLVFSIACLSALAAVAAIEPTADELAVAKAWRTRNLSNEVATLPFSFNYGGASSKEFLKSWKRESSTTKLDEYRTQETTTYSDPKTHLEVKCVAVYYSDYPAVEWTLYFKNAGSAPSPFLSDIQSLDTQLDMSGSPDYVLHYSNGSPSKIDDYRPFTALLGPSEEKRFTPVGGRATDGAFPYFNLQQGNAGLIVAVGWPGQWAASFSRDSGSGISLRAGQELTSFKLNPAEEVRSPLTLFLFYKGDWLRAQNIWRHWMIAHTIPRPGGKLPTPQLAGGSCPYYGPFVGNNQENQELFIRRYGEEGIKLDYWWIDAGWYPNNGKWTNTGTWEVDAKRFPNGLKAVSDYAHAHDMKLIVWFEPERVTPGTWLYEQHPEWLLKGNSDPNIPHAKDGSVLLNLGDPQAWDWVTNHVDKLITEQGIDTYRQDFNTQALGFWRANDAIDRQGITENHYVVGYLKYWDELKRRHPTMPIDDCASGGRRNDLESMRRSVPLWRSDYIIEPVGMQNQTYGISLWLPYEGMASQTFEKEGDGKKTIDAYAFRSDMYPSIHAHWDVRRNDLDYKRLRELVDQWRLISQYYMADYYPLTEYDPSPSAWIAWQFDRPETGDGVVQAFRRPENKTESMRLKLHGLDPAGRYKLTNLDAPGDFVMTGKVLSEIGLPVALKGQPDSAIITYKREMK